MYGPLMSDLAVWCNTAPLCSGHARQSLPELPSHSSVQLAAKHSCPTVSPPTTKPSRLSRSSAPHLPCRTALLSCFKLVCNLIITIQLCCQHPPPSRQPPALRNCTVLVGRSMPAAPARQPVCTASTAYSRLLTQDKKAFHIRPQPLMYRMRWVGGTKRKLRVLTMGQKMVPDA